MSGQQLSAFLQCLKQLGNNPSPPNQFKLQYNSLSKSYKQAQQRILQLQNSLIEETMHSERQSSIIELMKQIIHGEMDDVSILSFLKSLEEDLGGDPGLVQCIGEIERMLEGRRRKVMIEKQGKIVQIGIKCEELESSVVHLAGKVEELEKEIAFKQKQIEQKETNIEELKQFIKQQSLQKQTLSSSYNQLIQQNKNMSETVKTLRDKSKNETLESTHKSQQIEHLKQQIEQYNQTITTCNQNWKLSETNSKLLSSKLSILQSLLQELQPILGKDRSQMKHKLNKLVKNYRYFKEKHREKQNYKSSLCNSMKQFLSSQALELVREIEDNISSGYLYQELEELCVLQKERMKYYQEQEKEVRKYKMELLRLREGESIFSTKGMISVKSKCGWREREKELERTGKWNQTSEFRL